MVEQRKSRGDIVEIGDGGLKEWYIWREKGAGCAKQICSLHLARIQRA